MILSQRYPTVFNGIVSRRPRDAYGLIECRNHQNGFPWHTTRLHPKDASGKPQIEKSMTDSDRETLHGRVDEAV